DRADHLRTCTAPASNVERSPPDRTTPACSISSPSSGVMVSGTITVSVTVSDNVDVTSVDLLVDEFFGFTDNTAPFSFVWVTTTVGNGSHSFMATAHDAAGNFGTSTTVTVNVKNSAPDTTTPTCAFISSSSGDAV